MPDSIEKTQVIAATPQAIYDAWIGGDSHAAMTGSPATSEPVVGGGFTAWGGYITGTWQALEPGRRIVMHWSTSSFPDGAAPSVAEVLLSAEGKGTRVTIRHSEIPEGQGKDYDSGWDTHYYEPMAAHFNG